MSTLTRRSLLVSAAVAGLGMRERPDPYPKLSIPQAVTSVTSPALFIAAHPDDETLAMGVTIAEHVAAGQDVHVLWLSRGEASSARGQINGTSGSAWWGLTHDPAVESYTPLSADEFGAARICEATNAVSCLGSVVVHEAGLSDGGVTQADAEAAIVAVADVISPDGAVRLKTHTPIVDNHPDHLAAGAAVVALGDGDPARFGDRRYYTLPWYWQDPRLSQVSHSWDGPSSTEIAARAVNACHAYGAWSPPHTYAIGHHSVPDLWPDLMAQPRCMYHT